MNVLKIGFDQDSIFLKTKTKVEIAMPLCWFPRLQSATPRQREQYKLSPFGIHWEALDEDLSFEGFFKFNKDNTILKPKTTK